MDCGAARRDLGRDGGDRPLRGTLCDLRDPFGVGATATAAGFTCAICVLKFAFRLRIWKLLGMPPGPQNFGGAADFSTRPQRNPTQ